MKPTRKITKLRVNEISVVGEGDNPHADILILKHRDIVGVDLDAVGATLAEVRKAATDLAEELSEGGFDMDMKELTDKLDGIEKSLQTAQGRITELETANTELTKERDAALAEVEKAKTAAPAVSEEDVLKSLPEPVRAMIEKDRKENAELRASVEKERDQREADQEIAKVRETGIADADKFGACIHRIRKGKSTSEDADTMLDLIAKAKALSDGGAVLFTTIGKAHGKDLGDEVEGAVAKLNEATAAIQKAKPTLTAQQAYMEAIDANPALYELVSKQKPQAK